MRTIFQRLRRVVDGFIDHGSEGATPEKALMMRRARGFGLVAFVIMASAFTSSVLQGRAITAWFSIGGIIVYGVCMHFTSIQRGRFAELSSNVSIGFLLITITIASVILGGTSSASVTYPSVLLLGTMHVLGIRTAAVWTALSVVALAFVTFTATPIPAAPGTLALSPAVIFGSRASILVGVFAIAALGRRFEDLQTAQLQFLARHDPLTGLCNRREFDERLGQALARADRYQHRPALLFIDLDGFKAVNDQYGHGVGDDVLRGIAHVLDAQTRRTDAAGRIGGDEFVVLLEDGNDEKSAERYAERLLSELVATETEHVAPIAVRASIGIALFPDDGRTIESLTRAADSAMYDAKQHGGNRVALANRATPSRD